MANLILQNIIGAIFFGIHYGDLALSPALLLKWIDPFNNELFGLLAVALDFPALFISMLMNKASMLCYPQMKDST
jgi:hypothetical protein